ncbi:G patch domain-containing protein 1-like isoform X2 [Hylaeus volcanicus]|uniref:G patch domain-containing protein 1-like isoform X2 n=1 Tax=Hylaeus volcanicus TaxID=313075 RepID=UPI0023B80A54|nr:G patch domain-containing protein 1-like isoform X2 [Hylaeus volcanicus]
MLPPAGGSSRSNKRKAAAINESDETKFPRVATKFLGHPLNRYDIDEINVEGSFPDKLSRLAALTLAIPKEQKCLQVKGTTARHSDGRRVFHGAMTGGFVAGYNNTVGSAEGWTPTTFFSSQKQRSKLRHACIQDYMDDEDVEEMMTGKHPSGIFSTTNSSVTKSNISCPENAHPFQANALEFLIEKNVPPGQKILTSMGWKPSFLAVMTSVSYQLPPTQKRRYGPDLPSTQPVSQSGETPKASLNEDDKLLTNYQKRNERCKFFFQELLTQCSNMKRVKRLTKEGIGCDNNMMSTRKSESVSRSSQPFGFGILQDDEDEWDATEQHASLSTEKLDLRYYQNAQKISFSIAKSNTGPTLNDISFLKSIDILVRFPVPRQFNGLYTPSAAELKHKSDLQMGNIKGVIYDLLNHLKKKKTIAQITNVSTTIPALNENKLSDVTPFNYKTMTDEKIKFLQQFSTENRFVKDSEVTHYKNLYYPDNSEKQTRYDLFCLALEEKVPASLMLESQKKLSADAAKEERVEFGNNYRAFKAKHPNFELRFVDVGLSAVSNLIARRTFFNWDPDRILCKRYRVPYPWERKKFVDDRMVPGTPSKSNFFIQPSATKITSTASFVNTLISGLKHKPIVEKTANVSESISISVDQVVPETRPPMSIFKSVFGSVSSSV